MEIDCSTPSNLMVCDRLARLLQCTSHKPTRTGSLFTCNINNTTPFSRIPASRRGLAGSVYDSGGSKENAICSRTVVRVDVTCNFGVGRSYCQSKATKNTHNICMETSAPTELAEHQLSYPTVHRCWQRRRSNDKPLEKIILRSLK